MRCQFTYLTALAGGRLGGVTSLPTPDHLETARLVLRPRHPDEAATYRRLWTERDPRVPARRQIDADGRPSLEDIAAQLRAEVVAPGLQVLAVELREAGEVIGYCGTMATVATYSMRTIVPLRIAGILSSLFFVTYALLADVWPMLATELIILPINCWRLYQGLRPTPAAPAAVARRCSWATLAR